MNFFIKKDSTYPNLVFHLTEKLMNKLGITDDMMNNVAITFSMKNSENGIYKIANTAADLEIKTPKINFQDYKEYYLVYRFKEKNTNIVGNFEAEFRLDFLNDYCCPKLAIPNDNDFINVIISDTITKTSVL